jgi:flagellar hook-associated protein 2
MSDLSIPGVTSNVDTKAMIEALMEADRVKLAKKEEEVRALEDEKKVWQNLGLKVANLQESANKLYGFPNPFEEKVAVSADESILTATATRDAVEEDISFVVKQMASADRFMSSSLPRDFQPPSGTYRFRVGDEEREFSFPGGTLSQLADAVSRNVGDLLKAKVVDDTRETRVIILESQHLGADNRLIFDEAALDFALKSGVLESVAKTSRDIVPDPSVILPWGKTLSPDFYQLADEKLTVFPGGELKVALVPPFALNPNMVLELELEVDIEAAPEWEAPSRPAGPEIPTPGGIEFEGIEIENESSRIVLPPWEPPTRPEIIEDSGVLFIGSQGGVIDLPEVPTSKGSHELKIAVGELAANIDSILFRNRNTLRTFSFSDIRIFDPTTRGDNRPVNPLSEAGDAVVVMDGVEVARGTNTIEDLIPGVNVTLLSESEQSVALAIQRDTEIAKDAIIEMVGFYNQLLTRIDILTRNDSSVIEDAFFLSEEERDEAESHLGILQGDITLSQLKSRLRTVMLSPYPTTGGSELSLLAQLGISTNTARPGTAAIDKSRLRGYLEIDESKLDEGLAKHPDWVKELFGRDTDGDFAIDSGAAYTVDFNLKPFTSIGGVISNRTATVGGAITRRTREIASFSRRLEEKEAALKRKYGIMEGMLETLERNSKAIENFRVNTNPQEER